MRLVKPRALRRGDLIGVCAPASVVEPERLALGVAELEALGFAVRAPEGLLARRAFTAGSVQRRLDELHALFADPEVRAIVCARGGAGSGWLLGALDRGLVAGHPKLLVGYSDMTALHLALGRLGLASAHGPMVARELADGGYDRKSLLWTLAGEGAPPCFTGLDAWRPGTAEGRLRGGCLSLLASAAGTPWALDNRDGDGTILFLEDVDEPAYRLDRMLLQLRAAGAFEGVRGVVLGEMKGCAAPEGADYTLKEVLLEALGGLELPVAAGLPSGHTTRPGVTLALGVRARLEVDGDAGRLELLEPAVA